MNTIKKMIRILAVISLVLFTVCNSKLTEETSPVFCYSYDCPATVPYKYDTLPTVTLEINKIEKTKNIGYIFVGDSRTVGMNMCTGIDKLSNCFVVAEVGKGYDYLENVCLPKISEIKEGNPSIDKWVIVSLFGINDLHNAGKYKKLYEDLASECTLYLVSVNQVEYHNFIKNSDVVNFNEMLLSVPNTEYVDVYSYLEENGYSTGDGVHYTKDTYSKIYNQINNVVLFNNGE